MREVDENKSAEQPKVTLGVWREPVVKVGVQGGISGAEDQCC